jgi:thymidylate kinase
MSSKLSRELVIAAQLVDPATRSLIDFRRDVDWAAVLDILVRNKAPLVGLAGDPNLAACPLLELAGFQTAVNAQTETWRTYRHEYGLVRDRFKQRGIESVLFKSVGLAPSFPYTSDNMDTLVRREHIQAAREILGELGYVELRNIEEPQKFLFRKFEGGESVSAIHLHGTVGWGVPFLDDDALWKRVGVSEDDPLVLVPASGDALLVTIAHAFYENKSFKLMDIARIRFCLRGGNIDFPDIERIARERGWRDGLAFCLTLYNRLENWLYGDELIPDDALERARRVVKSNAWLSRQLENASKGDIVHFPFRLSFLFGKVMYYRKIMGDSRRRFVTRMCDVVSTLAWGIKLKLRIRGQRGMIVSFSGIDGSGKTVHIRSLVDAFAIAEVKAHSFWTRFGSSSREKGSGGPGAGNAGASDTAASLDRRRRRLRNPAMRFGWLACNLTVLVLRYNWRVRLKRRLGGVVICDRYVYDAIVEIGASLPDDPRLSRWAERLLTRVCPRPDVAWLLDVPADVSVRRQTDEGGSTASTEELSRQRSAYLKLAGTYGLNVVTTQSRPEETTSRVVRETLLAYYKNYGTWVNALLLSNPGQMNPKKDAR